MSGIVGILLAAGSSRRFGSNKLLHPLASGEPLGPRAARNLVTAVPRSLVVIRQGDTELADRFAALGLQVVENPEAERGMGSSLATGVSAAADAAGWLVALADMPWIQSHTILSLADALRHGASLAVPTYRGRRGHPVGFSREWRGQLQRLTGAEGARSLLAEHGDQMTSCDTADRGVLLDVDRPTDLRISG